jgi:methyl-accepting chemotaxis protein
MSWLRNLPIARKFTSAFGIVCILCVALGAYTFLTLRSIATKGADVSEVSFPVLVHLADMRGAMIQYRREDLNILLCPTPACAAVHTEKRQKQLNLYKDAAAAYEPLIRTPQDRASFQELSDSFSKYLEDSDRAIGLGAAGKIGDAVTLLQSDDTSAKINAAIASVSQNKDESAKFGTDEANAVTHESNRALWVNAGATLVIILLCALTGVILTRLIAPPLLAATAALERVAEKDLTVSVEESGSDEIGRLSTALNTSVASIRAVMQSVAQGAETLSAATTEISAKSVQSAGNAHSPPPPRR